MREVRFLVLLVKLIGRLGIDLFTRKVRCIFVVGFGNMSEQVLIKINKNTCGRIDEEILFVIYDNMSKQKCLWQITCTIAI